MKHIQTPLETVPAPVIILVRPQMAQNIGMVARAMMNCGLYELRLVSPREEHCSDAALSASSGAEDILRKAKVYPTLETATQDLNFILATTARPRGMTKSVYHPTKGIEQIQSHLNNNNKCGILFGAERTGLENHELIMADGIIEIPLNPLHCSLNLSQAVLLIGYEWIQKLQSGTDNSRHETGGSLLATKQELDCFLSFLENHLNQKGYFRFPDKTDRMHRNLRNIFTRNNLTSSEIKTLYGIINNLIRKDTHD